MSFDAPLGDLIIIEEVNGKRLVCALDEGIVVMNSAHIVNRNSFQL